MGINSDLASKAVPIYLQIYTDLKNQIINNKFLPEEQLPSENELKKQYSVSRHTIQHVFRLLVNEGLVIRRKGLGSFVKPIVKGADDSFQSITLRLGGLNKPETPLTQATIKYARRVAELTRNHVKVEVHHSSKFGSGAEHIRQVANMELDMFVAAVDWLELLDPNWGVLGIPFLFRDLDHVKAFVASPINEELKSRLLERSKVRVIAGNWYRPANVVISKKPCFNLKDLQGVRFRVPPIPIYSKVWETLGACPVEIPWANVKKHFDHGKIEATEAPIDSILGMGLDHSAPYITYTRHVYSRACIIMAETQFQDLRTDLQEAIIKAGREIGDFYSEFAHNIFLKDKEKMIENGARFIETDLTPFREKISPLAQSLYTEGSFSRKLYNYIKKL